MIHPHMLALIDEHAKIERNNPANFCTACGHSLRYHREHGDCTICDCQITATP